MRDQYSGIEVKKRVWTYGFKGQASGFNRLVTDLQHFPLLGIKPHCFNGCQVEKGWIKVLRRAINKVSSKNIEATRSFIVLVITRVDLVPSTWHRIEFLKEANSLSINVEPWTRNFGAVPWTLLEEKIPQGRWWVDISGKTTSCNWLDIAKPWR